MNPSEPSRGLLGRFLFSTNHKDVALQYAATASLFLLFGLGLVSIIRWQLAFPETVIPLIGRFFDENSVFAPAGVLLPDAFNQLLGMHGTIMIFLGVVPFAVGGFGGYVTPLQIGANVTAFPRLGKMGYWCFLAGGAAILSSFFTHGGPANAGWTSYPPLSVLAPAGQDLWLVGIVAVGLSSILHAINLVTTILQLRAPGLSMMRLPYFVWAQFVTGLLLILSFPPALAGGLLLLSDRLMQTSFFLPAGLLLSGEALDVTGGGSPLLWQHLFWFLGHPEVYVLLLPALGIVAEVIAANTHKPLWGYRAMVFASLFLGVMSLLVWAHHMYVAGIGAGMSKFFQTATMIISVPSVIILTALLTTLWGARIKFTLPMLFALAMIPCFGFGGLTGLPLGLAETNVHLHDTLYVVGHFHFIVGPGVLLGLFAGIYHWYPKLTGRRLNTLLGHLHFWPSLLGMAGVFIPMMIQGMGGVSRRLYDGGRSYAHGQEVEWLQGPMLHAILLLTLAQLFFLFNLAWSWKRGREAGSNPWGATTLDWTETAPEAIHVRRPAYTYVKGDGCLEGIPQDAPAGEGT